ncbi:MAG: 50S ribosomal protein L24 [Clostridia bacterium]|nr:50S ribosomal protein L24 [Clostridia bacterium]
MVRVPRKLHVKKGDTVEIISGKNKNKRGKVLAVSPKKGMIIVEGVNILKKHQKPRGANQQGGIIKQEGPIYSSKAMLVCKRCNKRTRVGYQILEDKTKVRVCKVCKEVIND